MDYTDTKKIPKDYSVLGDFFSIREKCLLVFNGMFAKELEREVVSLH